MNNVMIRFEYGVEDLVSKDFGPFDYVQLTYRELRVGPDGEPFAIYDPEQDRWILTDDPNMYSDVVIYAFE